MKWNRSLSYVVIFLSTATSASSSVERATNLDGFPSLSGGNDSSSISNPKPGIPPPPPPKDDLLNVGQAFASWSASTNKTTLKNNITDSQERSEESRRKDPPSLFSVARSNEQRQPLPFKGTTESRVIPPPPPSRRSFQSDPRGSISDQLLFQGNSTKQSSQSHEIKLPPPRPPLQEVAVKHQHDKPPPPPKTDAAQIFTNKPPPPPKIAMEMHPSNNEMKNEPYSQQNHLSQSTFQRPMYEQHQKYTPMHVAPERPSYQQFEQHQYQRPPIPRPRTIPPNQNQWQQQHQWQPPRSNAPIRQTPKQESSSSFLNTLWKKVERGLDSLADVENTVTEQAQQLVVRKKPMSTAKQQKPVKTMPATPEERFQNRRDNARGYTTPDPNLMRKVNWANVRTSRAVSNNGGSTHESSTTTLEQKAPTQTPMTGPVEALSPKRYASTLPFHHAKKAPEQKQIPKEGGAVDRRPLEFRASAKIAVETIAKPQQKKYDERRFPDEDDNERSSLLSKFGRLVPRVPRLRFRRGMSGELAHSALEAWKADEEESLAQKRKGWLPFFGGHSTKEKSAVVSEVEIPAMESLSSRLGSDKSKDTVLKPSEFHTCRSIGRQKAFFDVLSVGFILALVQQLRSIEGFDFQTIAGQDTEAMFRLWAGTLESWAPHALACAFLSWQQGRNLARRKELFVVDEVTESAMVDANYGAMLLRLTSGTPIDRKAIDLVLLGARSKIASVIANTRLKTFAFVAVVFISILWGPDFRPILEHLLMVFTSLKGFMQWPVDLAAVISNAKSTLAASYLTFATIIMDSVTAMLDHPLLFSFKTSVGLALIAVSLLPSLIRQGRQEDLDFPFADEEEQDDRLYRAMTSQLVGFGSSSANRLNLMADNLLESLLDRWVLLMSNAKSESGPLRSSLKALAQRYWFSFLSTTVLLAPFSFFVLGAIHVESTNTLSKKLGSLFDVTCIFIAAQLLAWKAIDKTSFTARLSRKTKSFLESIASTVDERKAIQVDPTPGIDFIASISPSAGISISHMWASFATKRAWALRGVSVSCQNGEVVLVLGCDSTSKSNLVRAVAEKLLDPAPTSRSFIPAQGSLNLGGLDIQKWDKKLLRKRIGIFLNDVRSLGDSAQLLSGLSLEEILDPRACAGVQDIVDEPGEKERSAMISALKLTGLYSSLLPRLPSKLATTVTANEEDGRAMSASSRCELLPPSEWRKLLLARVIARTIYSNENSAASNGTSSNSLVGSSLIIEDFSMYFSEADEAAFISDLRKTGAASIVTSDRWSSGRYVDKIVIIRDGAVVETGTHQELMSKGVQRSIYAAQARKALV